MTTATGQSVGNQNCQICGGKIGGITYKIGRKSVCLNCYNNPPPPKISASHPFLEIAYKLQEKIPIWYDDKAVLWIWSGNSYRRVDFKKEDVVLMCALNNELAVTDFLDRKYKIPLLDAVRMSANDRKVAPITPNWINTMSGVYNLNTGNLLPPSPEYFFSEPIPHRIGASTETPTIDRLFTEWVGEEKKQVLYEQTAYSILDSYPIHRVFFHYGKGGDGKGQYHKLQNRFVGDINYTTASLKKLVSERFEVAKLYKKKLCVIDETDFKVLDTDVIKSLSGDGKVSAEFKNGQPFDFNNTAKVTISTNNLPPTLDKSRGWKRRTNVIDFPNEFEEGRTDAIDAIQGWEYENLLKKCLTEVLPALLNRGKFSNDGTVEQRGQAYEDRTDPVGKYIRSECIAEYGEYDEDVMYREFLAWSKQKVGIVLKRTDFRAEINNKGYNTYKDAHKAWKVSGLRHKSQQSQAAINLGPIEPLSL